MYDKATNNVFVVNDRSTKAGWQAWRIVSAQKQGNAKQGVSWVRLPSRRGVALFRTLITDRKQLAHFQSIQKKASCTQAK